MRTSLGIAALLSLTSVAAVEAMGPPGDEVTTGNPPAAAALTANATYMLRGLGGKCMTIQGSGQSGDRIVLSQCTGTNTQRFQAIKFADVYELRAFGRCVHVQGGRFQNRTPLQLFGCNSSAAQRFDIRGDLIRPKASTGFAVEVAGGVTANGTPVQLFSRNLTASQAWKFVPIGIPGNTTAGVSITSSSIPGCTAEQVASWDSAMTEQEGAAVSDPRNQNIGLASADRNDGYVPMTGSKETFCGSFQRFGFADDDDWNVHIAPFLPRYIAMKNLFGGTNRSSLEAEITVDRRYRGSSPWFHVDRKASPLAPPFASGGGHTICAFGPWVNDRSHQNETGFDGCNSTCGPKLEIHPSEFLWWRDTLPPFTDTNNRTVSTEYITFLHMQDDSTDFDDVDNFSNVSATPAGWEPWSNSPLRGVVRIPWLFTPGSPIPQFGAGPAITEIRIIDDFTANIVTSTTAASNDQTTASEQTLAIDGRIVLRVSETTEVDANLGVRIHEVDRFCRRPGTNQILGFVAIRDDIGGNDDGDNEGTHVFAVAKSTVTPSSLIFELPSGMIFLP